MVADSMDGWPFNVKIVTSCLKSRCSPRSVLTSQEEPLRKPKDEIFVVDVFALVRCGSAELGELEFQTDNYGEESTWEIYPVGSDEAIAQGGPFPDSTYTSQMIPLPSGEYNLVVSDAFGDGICCDFGRDGSV